MEEFLEGYKKVVDRATVDAILTRLHEKIDIDKCQFLEYIYKDTLNNLFTNSESMRIVISGISFETRL